MHDCYSPEQFAYSPPLAVVGWAKIAGVTAATLRDARSHNGWRCLSANGRVTSTMYNTQILCTNYCYAYYINIVHFGAATMSHKCARASAAIE